MQVPSKKCLLLYQLLLIKMWLTFELVLERKETDLGKESTVHRPIMQKRQRKHRRVETNPSFYWLTNNRSTTKVTNIIFPWFDLLDAPLQKPSVSKKHIIKNSRGHTHVCYVNDSKWWWWLKFMVYYCFLFRFGWWWVRMRCLWR